jgi:hypothetical protein
MGAMPAAQRPMGAMPPQWTGALPMPSPPQTSPAASPADPGAASAAAPGAAPVVRVPAAAAWLGAAGLVPFVACAAAAHLGPEAWRGAALGALAGYGATILAFMGGCRWGFAAAGMGEGPTWRPLAASVLPSLLAWGALALGGPWGLALLAGGLLALWAADVALTRSGGAPRWWGRLRAPLSVVAAIALGAGALAG